jgi:hypothetical protein
MVSRGVPDGGVEKDVSLLQTDDSGVRIDAALETLLVLPWSRRRPSGEAASEWGCVLDPEAWAGPEAGDPVAGVREPAAVERETAAADAFGEAGPEPLELRDSLVDPRPPGAGQTRPVAARRCSIRRKLGKLGADFVERQPDPLGEDDERDPPEHRAGISPVAGAGPRGRDQAPLLVETQRRGGDAAAPRDLADRQQCRHSGRVTAITFDFKCT